jgi:hypothetical protein
MQSIAQLANILQALAGVPAGNIAGNRVKANMKRTIEVNYGFISYAA